ncbi:MAG TPA: AAA family ATPase [Ktedonobacterales bacterium]|nr:AAA family ATPase [Ktedonobacterales bacterium]
MAELVLSLLGAPRIERDSSPLTVDTRKAVALLAYGVITRRPSSRDALATLLWPEYDQIHARATLRRTLSALGKALGSGYLDIGRDTIGIQSSADIRLDVEDFQRQLAECQTHGHPATDVCAACLEPLETAARLYRDDFMAGFALRDSPAFDDWQFFQRETLRRQLGSALERLTRGYIATGQYDAAIDCARRWLALDRLHEPAHRYLMRLYAWSGQRTAALRQYHECVHALEQELGVSPLEATTRLYEAIKDKRPPAPPARTTSAASHAPTPSTAPEGAIHTSPTRSTDTLVSMAASESYPLAGRADEWAELERTYASIRESGRVIVLEGEAGIGKTRLAEDFALRARQDGATVVAARCYDGEASLAYAPVAAALRTALADQSAARQLSKLPERWLVEASRLVPEVGGLHPGLPPAPPLDSPGAQSQFFEGLRQVLVTACQGSKPGILFFDDVQWADSASLDVLTYVVRRLRDVPTCVLLTWRDSEASITPQLRFLLAGAERAGVATLIHLSRLSEDAVVDLLRTAAGVPALPETAKRLHEETEGVPFFLVEYLRVLAKDVVTPEQQNWAVTGGIQQLLRSRLGAVDGTSAQVLTAAAVIGRWFDFETVREVSGRSEEETVGALEELLGRGLIRELRGMSGPVPTYDFSHEKLRSLYYDEVSLARRRLLHRRVAEALVSARRRDHEGTGSLGQIAHHYLMGGDRATAANYYRQAGERARSLYANAEALAHLRTALALGSPHVAELHEVIGDLHTFLGEYALALASYAEAAATTESEAGARLEHKIGNVYARRGEWEQAQTHFDSAVAALGRSDGPATTGALARIYADWSLVAHRRGLLDQAWQLAHHARELVADATDTEGLRALAQAHNILGVLASSRGDVDDAISHLERSLALAETADDASARAAALNNLALALASRGDVERAIPHAEAALALSVAQGDRHHEAALHNNIADLLHAVGRPTDAMTHLKQAVSIYAEIGVEAGAVQPEIWKLTEW